MDWCLAWWSALSNLSHSKERVKGQTTRQDALMVNIAACWEQIAKAKGARARRTSFCRYLAVLADVSRVILTIQRSWRGERLLSGVGRSLDTEDVSIFQNRYGLHKIDLGQGLIAYAASEANDLSALESKLAQQAKDLRLVQSNTRYIVIVIVVLLLATGLIPVRERVIADATVVSEHKRVLVSEVEGIVTEHIPNFSTIHKDQVLAVLDAQTLQTETITTRSEIEILTIQLTESSVYVDAENTRVLQARLDAAKAKFKRLENLLQKQTLRAPIEGVIEWEPDLPGSFVSLGQILGRVREQTSSTLHIQVPVADRIKFEQDESVEFVNGNGSFETLEAEISQISPVIEYRDGLAFFTVVAQLDRATSVGVTGKATLFGQTTPIWQWVFRKPMLNVIAWIG